MQAGQAERILFLVDRDQLAKQAIEAIQDLLPSYSSYWLKPGIVRQEKQITVCLLQTMIGRYQECTSGYFDVVVADECHRSIYGAWQTALTHFDALHIGLTATPAIYIERNTFQFYRCKDDTPDLEPLALQERHGAARLHPRDEVFPYMASLAKDEPEWPSTSAMPCWKIVDSNVLKQVIDELDSFEFRKLGPDVKGDIFECSESPPPTPPSGVDKVWFYEVRNDGYDPDKIAGGGRVETPEKNDIPDLLTHWKAYKAGGFAAPLGLEANTLLPHGSEEPTCWWVSREKLT